jgi:hypothetical protein
MSWFKKPKRKIIIYPESNNINNIPQSWLNENNTLRIKLAQMTRLRRNPSWGATNSENDPRNMAYELQENIKKIIKERRNLEKRSSLCQRITRGVSRWLPCGDYNKLDHNERMARKARNGRKTRKIRKVKTHTKD